MNLLSLYHFFAGKASDKQKEAIKRWAESSPDNYETLCREKKIFDAGILLVDKKELSQKENAPLLYKLINYTVKIAAVFFFVFVPRHICMEDSYSVCHFADDGDGNCPDGTDCEHESGYDRGSAGSLALVGMFLYARHRPDTVFCIGVRLYDGDSRTLHEQCGEASQTIKEEDDICLKN